MWTNKQLKYHVDAAKLLIKIKDLTFDHIRKNHSISEYEVQQFILEKFVEYGLHSDKDPPIVGFGKHTATPEFYPKKESSRLTPGTFILIDLWAKFENKEAPFADITWVAYHGNKVPKDILHVFDVAALARDKTLDFISKELRNNRIPTGKSADNITRLAIVDAGFGSNIKHDVGHSLGTLRDHGGKPDWLYPKNLSTLNKVLGYTIEPGIYLDGKFGVRLELDFYISKDDKLVVTTAIQKKIVLV